MCKTHTFWMSVPPSSPDLESADAASAQAEALAAAMAEVLRPLARLAVARGVPFATVEALFKSAFVEAARQAQPPSAAARSVSRIATATGLTRREVTRLLQAENPPPRRRPIAAELFARWAGEPPYLDDAGQPRALARQGPAPSFESLAQSVTRDVHPRSLLDELLRLGLARLDAEADRVELVRDAFVPRGDVARMLAFLGANVGDHLAAAVVNVLGTGSEHFEQAVFADELSAESVARARVLIKAQWRALSAALVPALEELIEDDRAAGRPQDQRLRVGLYSWTDAMEPAPAPTVAPDPS